MTQSTNEPGLQTIALQQHANLGISTSSKWDWAKSSTHTQKSVQTLQKVGETKFLRNHYG